MNFQEIQSSNKGLMMHPKITLKLKDEFNNLEVTHIFEEETLDVVLRRTEDFLRGCGFIFDGHLGIIEEDKEPEWKE